MLWVSSYLLREAHRHKTARQINIHIYIYMYVSTCMSMSVFGSLFLCRPYVRMPSSRSKPGPSAINLKIYTTLDRFVYQVRLNIPYHSSCYYCLPYSTLILYNVIKHTARSTFCKIIRMKLFGSAGLSAIELGLGSRFGVCFLLTFWVSLSASWWREVWSQTVQTLKPKSKHYT